MRRRAAGPETADTRRMNVNFVPAAAIAAAVLLGIQGAALADTPPVAQPCDAVCIAEAHGGSPVSSWTTYQPPPAVATFSTSSKGVLLFTPGVPALPKNAVPVFVPKGLILPVQTMQSYSSYGSAPGGKLRYEILQNVVVNGYLIAMKGDTAEGAVQSAHQGEQGIASLFLSGGTGSELRVSVDRVYNFCGDTINVAFDRNEYRDYRGNLITMVMPWVWPDKDVHITRGQKYSAFTDRPQKVCGVATTETNSPPPSGALQTTDR